MTIMTVFVDGSHQRAERSISSHYAGNCCLSLRSPPPAATDWLLMAHEPTLEARREGDLCRPDSRSDVCLIIGATSARNVSWQCGRISRSTTITTTIVRPPPREEKSTSQAGVRALFPEQVSRDERISFYLSSSCTWSPNYSGRLHILQPTAAYIISVVYPTISLSFSLSDICYNYIGSYWKIIYS